MNSVKDGKLADFTDEKTNMIESYVQKEFLIILYYNVSLFQEQLKLLKLSGSVYLMIGFANG